MTDFKPMLAKSPKYDEKTGNPVIASFPVGVQIKLDGIRASVVDGKLVSRKLKAIPNAEIRAALERPEFEGLDGEIIVGAPEAEGCMQRSSSFVMSESKTGEPWKFCAFDLWDMGDADGYERPATLENLFTVWANDPALADIPLEIVKMYKVEDMDALIDFEQAAVAEGHEGIIVRDLDAPYKFGRSGLKGPLLKIKRFIDFEAEILGVYEEMHNGNEAKRDAFGRTERSTAKAGKTGKNTLGGFYLKALNGPCAGVKFKCGTGFSAHQRQEFWLAHNGPHRARPEGLTGLTAKIKSFPVGVKKAPRFPVFLGFRNTAIDG